MIINVRLIRENRNIKMLSLAINSGIGRTTLSEIEHGKHIPSVLVALKIARALNCKVEDLFELEKGDY